MPLLNNMEEKLTKAVQQHPCIYDKSRKDYRDKLAKKKAWLAVGAAVGVKSELCQKRWKTLRDRFIRECAKKPDSGGGAERLGSSWKYFKLLTFLRSHTPHRITDTSTEFMNDDRESSPRLCSPVPSFSPEPSFTSEPSSSEEREKFNVLVDVVKDYVEKRASQNARSRNEAFFKVLDSYLLKLPEPVQDVTKVEILKLVLDKLQSTAVS